MLQESQGGILRAPPPVESTRHPPRSIVVEKIVPNHQLCGKHSSFALHRTAGTLIEIIAIMDVWDFALLGGAAGAGLAAVELAFPYSRTGRNSIENFCTLDHHVLGTVHVELDLRRQ